MFPNKIGSMVRATVTLMAMALAGCVGDATGDESSLDDGAEEAVEEVAQALDTCTPFGSGGGTWGDILTLCKTSNNYLYVKKRSGSFTSSGVMKLQIWLGTIMTTNVYPGTTTVYFGPQLPGWYSAVYESNAPGTAWTGQIQVK